MFLYRRGRWYHYRARIPSDLASIYNRYEFHQSLKTCDGQSAHAVANKLH
jgi:hypothetical protein